MPIQPDSDATLQDRLAYTTVSVDDIDELVSLRIAAMRESLEHVGRYDPSRARQRLVDSFYPSGTRFILLDDISVGFYTLRTNGDFFHLDHLYIHPDCQSTGIGSKVMELLFGVAARAGKSIRLNALRESRSNIFYRRHGFTQTDEGEWDIYYIWKPSLFSRPEKKR